ncbi:MAG: hypothetical protein JXA99_11035 [Candidatus Lokiarchaeota archaeon]|nr:hypothetical protein [Candidatus Lokiarchaeota archaeon]
MHFQDYPIAYPIRIPLIAFEWGLIIICFELGLFFLMSNKRKTNFIKIEQKLGYSIIFISYGLMRFFTLLSDFYSIESFYRIFFIELRYVCMTFGALLFIFFIEKNNKYFIMKFFFSLTTLIFVLLFLIFILFINEFYIIFYLLIWLIVIVFLIIHAFDIAKNIPHLEKNKSEILKFVVSILLLIFGNIISLDIFTFYLGHEIRLLGAILQIICICLIFRFLLNHPFIYKFNWKTIVEDFYILSLNGANLFYKAYSGGKKKIDASLVSGALLTINIMLKNLSLSPGKGIEIIEKEGHILYIYTGKYCIGTIISKMNVDYLKYYLKKLIERIEIIYKNIFENWKGELRVFSPIESIIEEIFPH